MEHIFDKLPLTPSGSNKISAHEKEMNDIFNGLKEIDNKGINECLPKFVAIDLGNIPKIIPGELDLVSLLERVSQIEQNMCKVERNVVKHDQLLTKLSQCKTQNQTTCDNQSQYTTGANSSGQSRSYPPPVSNMQVVTESESEPSTSIASQATKLLYSGAAAAGVVGVELDKDGFQLMTGVKSKKNVLKKSNNALYGQKKTDVIKSAPRRKELFIFNVAKDTGAESIKSFLLEENMIVMEIECMSHCDAWTESYRVLLTGEELDNVTDSNFWPYGIGCRQYFRKRVDKSASKFQG